ncbi:coiled-coil domain-containing protein 117 isoform 2-T2 [Anomaloglossus baeobatrachus]|uniref:coiled-coil domain-containing protein 117 isoform X2 n=1 Tax=Anomaloglossus baeobatrachus TaxID=238106 RepID=UPI003F501520
MAVTDRAFGAVPLYGMEYRQTSHPFLQRTSTPGIVDISTLSSSVNELGQINSPLMASGLNSNGSHYMHHQFNVNPRYVGENVGLFLGVEAPIPNPAGTQTLPQITCTSHPRPSRKHKCQEDNDCPLKKRRVSASPTQSVFHDAPDIFSGRSGPPFWASSHSQVKEADILPTVADQSTPTEDMEDVAVESQSDAVLRRIRDIESRLVVEDEDEDDVNDSRVGHLPTLVMSDVLVEGFKKGLDESLTKKIVASINRPSMELVLWKPHPEFLVNKLQSVASSHKANKEARKKIQSTPVTPLLRGVDPSAADKPCTSHGDCDIDSMWNREEEEMEL